jgi:aminoglycoside phosphotransferase (APT) family kinase protein
MNNALYRLERQGQAWAVKLCVDDERRRAQREHGALRWLEGAGADLAPPALGLDTSGTILPYPAVAYEWLEGEPLSQAAQGQPAPVGGLTEAQLAALLESVQRMHGIRMQSEAGLPEAWFHWFDRRPYLEELRSFLARYAEWLCENIAAGRAINTRLEKIATACEQALGKSPASIDRGSVPLRLCHVDPNPANAIWGRDGRLRWVDWEYSGWGDPALDLAEYRWHEAFAFLSAEQVNWMRANYAWPQGDDGFGERLRLWDALLAARWPFLLLRRLWSAANGPDRERLSVPVAQAAEVETRMLALIERAEEFYSKEHSV